MTRAEIMEQLREILLLADDKNADIVKNCTEDTKLTTELHLASVGMLYLVISIEETFKIVFENVSVKDFVTVGDVLDYIEEHRK